MKCIWFNCRKDIGDRQLFCNNACKRCWYNNFFKIGSDRGTECLKCRKKVNDDHSNIDDKALIELMKHLREDCREEDKCCENCRQYLSNLNSEPWEKTKLKCKNEAKSCYHDFAGISFYDQERKKIIAKPTLDTITLMECNKCDKSFKKNNWGDQELDDNHKIGVRDNLSGMIIHVGDLPSNFLCQDCQQTLTSWNLESWEKNKLKVKKEAKYCKHHYHPSGSGISQIIYLDKNEKELPKENVLGHIMVLRCSKEDCSFVAQGNKWDDFPLDNNHKLVSGSLIHVKNIPNDNPPSNPIILNQIWQYFLQNSVQQITLKDGKLEVKYKDQSIKVIPVNTPELQIISDYCQNQLDNTITYEQIQRERERERESKNPTIYTPWIIGGGSLLVIVIILRLAFSKRKKRKTYWKKENLSLEEIGWKGEEEVLNTIRNFIEGKGPTNYLLTNSLVLQKNHWSCEIDILLLTRKWIYIIEVKNYGRGRLSGNLNNEHLEYSYEVWGERQHRRRRIYSPFYQNETHVQRFKDYFQLPNNQNILGVVCFNSPHLGINLKENKKTVFKNKHLWVSNRDGESIVDLLYRYEEKDTQLPFFEQLKEKINQEDFSSDKIRKRQDWAKAVKKAKGVDEDS